MIDDQGRSVVAGFADNADGDQVFAVARYLPGGSLDPSFGGGDGIVLIDIVFVSDPRRAPDLSFDRANAVALQQVGGDQRIVVGGLSCNEVFDGFIDCRWALARLLDSGAPDTSFGPGSDGQHTHQIGTAFDGFGGSNDRIEGLAIQTDGKIVAVGVAVR